MAEDCPPFTAETQKYWEKLVTRPQQDPLCLCCSPTSLPWAVGLGCPQGCCLWGDALDVPQIKIFSVVPQLEACSTAPSLSQHPSCVYCHGTFSLGGKGGSLGRLWVMVVRGIEQSRFCFVLQLCPVVDIVMNLVNIHLLSTLNGGLLVEGEARLPRVSHRRNKSHFPCQVPSVHQQHSSTSAGLLLSLEFTSQCSNELLPPWPFLFYFYASPLDFSYCL